MVLGDLINDKPEMFDGGDAKPSGVPTKSDSPFRVNVCLSLATALTQGHVYLGRFPGSSNSDV